MSEDFDFTDGNKTYTVDPQEFDFTGGESSYSTDAVDFDFTDGGYGGSEDSEFTFDSFDTMPARQDRLGRGIDLLESTLGAAVQAGGEIVGYDDAVEIGKAYKEANQLQADLEAEQADSIGEMLVEALPFVGAVAAPTLAGLAVGGPIGGAVGLALGSFGVNLGDSKLIQEELGDKTASGVGTLATAGAATAVDVLTGGVIGQSLKAPVKEAIKKGAVRNIMESAGVGAVGAGGAQAALETGATLAAGVDFDEDRLDAIANNVAIASAFGAGVGGVGGAGVSGINKLRELQEQYDIKAEARLKGEVGQGLPETNPVAVEDPNILVQGVGRFLGKALTPIKNSVNRNSVYKRLSANVAQDRANRNINDVDGNKISTVSVNEGFYAGKFGEDLAKAFKDERATQKGFDDVAEGLDTPEAKITTDILDKAATFLEDEVGIKVDRMQKFLPLSLDLKRISKDRNKFIDDMLTSARERINEDGKFKQADYDEFEKALPRYVEDLIDNGGPSTGKAISSTDGDADLAARLLEAKDEKTRAALKEEILQKKKSNERVASNKIKGAEKDSISGVKSSVEKSRFLSPVATKTLEQWKNPNMSAADRLNNYVNEVATRAAWVKAYGVDGEKLKAQLWEAALEDLENGLDFDVKAHQRFIDSANAQQRQYNRDNSSKWRKFSEKVRVYQSVRTLPSAFLSSIVEPMLVLEGIGVKGGVTGFGDTLRLLAGKTARKFTGKTSLKTAELEKVLEQHNVSRHNAVSTVSQRFDADVINMSNWERILFKLNGLAYWTEYNRAIAAFAANNALKNTTEKLYKHSSGGKQLSRREWVKAGEKLEQAGLTVDEALSAYDGRTGEWNKASAQYDSVVKAGINLINDVVLKPDAGNRPLWQSDPNLILAAQLKGWQSVFSNTVLTRWADRIFKTGAVESPQQAFKISLFLGFYLSGLMAQTAIKDVSSDGEFELDERSFMDLIMLALGQLGPFGMLTDSVAGGRSGPARTVLAAVGGPSGTQAVDLASYVTGVLNDSIKPNEAVREVMISVGVPNIPSSGAIRDLMRETF